MIDNDYRLGDAKSEAFGQDAMLQPAPVEKIPDGPTTPQVAYQMVKDETYAQTQPRLNLATFVTTYMDCLLYRSPRPRDGLLSRMPSSA